MVSYGIRVVCYGKGSFRHLALHCAVMGAEGGWEEWGVREVWEELTVNTSRLLGGTLVCQGEYGVVASLWDRTGIRKPLDI